MTRARRASASPPSLDSNFLPGGQEKLSEEWPGSSACVCPRAASRRSSLRDGWQVLRAAFGPVVRARAARARRARAVCESTGAQDALLARRRVRRPFVRDGSLCGSTPATGRRAEARRAREGEFVGPPDFIAQEEMHRHEGWWWSPSPARDRRAAHGRVHGRAHAHRRSVSIRSRRSPGSRTRVPAARTRHCGSRSWKRGRRRAAVRRVGPREASVPLHRCAGRRAGRLRCSSWTARSGTKRCWALDGRRLRRRSAHHLHAAHRARRRGIQPRADLAALPREGGFLWIAERDDSGPQPAARGRRLARASADPVGGCACSRSSRSTKLAVAYVNATTDALEDDVYVVSLTGHGARCSVSAEPGTDELVIAPGARGARCARTGPSPERSHAGRGRGGGRSAN